jgi:aerobic carbon-monoxide dehydrogenase medium subunit
MYPKPIESYFAPNSLDEALRLLGAHREAKVIAGGQSLMPMLKLRLVEPKYLIDLNRIAGLSEFRETGETITVGAMVRHADMAANDLVGRALPLLRDAARVIGDPQIRNRGTIGGSLAHADPAADYPTATLALDARMIVRGVNGARRTIPARDFVTGPLSTALRADELLTEIEFPKPAARAGGAYLKHALVAGDFAVISIAVQLTLDHAGRCARAAVAIGGLPAGPARPQGIADLLEGTALDAATLRRAGQAAAQAVEVASDARASSTYRRNLIQSYLPQAVELAKRRAEG